MSAGTTKKEGIAHCTTCGSQFDLQRAHLCHAHNHADHAQSCRTTLLCRTCHHELDFSKTSACKNQALLKTYLKKMERAGL